MRTLFLSVLVFGASCNCGSDSGVDAGRDASIGNQSSGGGSTLGGGTATGGGTSSGGGLQVGGGAVTGGGSSSGGGTSLGGGSVSGGGAQVGGGAAGGGSNVGGGSAAGGGSVGGGSGDAGAPDAGTLDGGSSDAGCAGSAGACSGVCASTPAVCQGTSWVCTGPGFEATETTCDGFDNDCDGTVDEGCAACSVNLAGVNQNLFGIWDIDFDTQCNSYLTTIVSGPDHLTIVPPDGGGAIATFLGNANQNMGYGVVDPNPANRRVVVTYSCCETCGCQAKNGLTLLYTCDAGDPSCGCGGQSHCPGFADAPFLAAGSEDTSVTSSLGIPVATPTGLTAGPGGAFFVGNWRPQTCAVDAGTCTPCDPAHPSQWCTPSHPACCDSTALGRLAEFTPPSLAAEPQFRVVAIWPGDEILTLTTSRTGDVLVGVKTSGGGAVYRFVPATRAGSTVATFSAPVNSIAEDRRSGDLYIELTSGTPRLNRVSPTGAPLVLPTGLTTGITGTGHLEFGPDFMLYRLVPASNQSSRLTGYVVP